MVIAETRRSGNGYAVGLWLMREIAEDWNPEVFSILVKLKTDIVGLRFRIDICVGNCM